MDRQRLATWFAYASGIALVATATLHTMATPRINTLAASVPGDAGVLLPLLFIAFGITLALAGILVALVGPRAGRFDYLVLGVVALFPLSGAALQMYYLGFIAPTALLLMDGLLVIVTAALSKPVT